MRPRTAARQATIDRARRWREQRDACRMRWQVIAEVAGIDEPRFESILGAKAVPTEEEVAAVETAFEVLLRHRVEGAGA